jgi:opacity protein-like surface antigen
MLSSRTVRPLPVHFSLFVALMLVVSPGSAALAEGDVDVYSRPGTNIQVGFVQAWGQFDDPNTPNRIGVDISMGARINRYLGAEVGFEGISNWRIYDVKTSSYAIMATAKGFYPFRGIGPIKSIQPFALVGGGTLISLQGKDYVSRFAYRFGGGLDLMLTKSLFFSVTYRYTGNLDDFGYTNIVYGLGYKFN